MDYSKISRIGDRAVNEDFIDIFTIGEKGVFIVADGLGGQGFGEIASKEAAEAVKKFFIKNCSEPLADVLPQAFGAAHDKLKVIQQEVGTSSSFKTTLAVLVVDEDTIMWGNIGDSRIYRFENNALVERTLDHSIPQLMVSIGEIEPEEIRNHAARNKLTRVLGDEDEIMKPSISDLTVKSKNNAFLLCTDGFWEMIEDHEIEQAFNKSSDSYEWLDLMLKKIEDKTRQKAMDNYSAITVIL